MTQTILVTGVSGFIGGYVAREALTRGYRVTGLDRTASSIPGVAFVEGDIRDRRLLREVMRGVDRVVHLAAITSNVEFTSDPMVCYDINVSGFLSVIDAAARSGCERFVYASSAAVYIDSFSEDTVLDPVGQSNHYAKSKIMNEMLARSYNDIHTIQTTGLRYFNVYGRGENEKGDYASIVSLFLKARRRGACLEVYGDGTQTRDLIEVTDAAWLTLEALERGSRRIYNVGTGATTTYGAIATMIDRDRIKYVPNPLVSYQYYTRADTKCLTELLGDRRLRRLEEGIAEMGRALHDVPD